MGLGVTERIARTVAGYGVCGVGLRGEYVHHMGFGVEVAWGFGGRLRRFDL